MEHVKNEAGEFEFYVRILGPDGHIKRAWYFYAKDEATASSMVATDPRITTDTEYVLTQVQEI